jgi:putative transposase
MTTAGAPSLSISPRVQLTARQQACLEQLVRRQTSPQRLVRRAKILLARATGATQCHVMRQLPLNRGPVQVWCRRWCALTSKLEQMEADGSSAQVLTTVIVEALTDHPRAGTPATFTAEQIVQIVAVACEDPAHSGRPVSHWTPREGAEEVRKRGLVETISTRSVGGGGKIRRICSPTGASTGSTPSRLTPWHLPPKWRLCVKRISRRQPWPRTEALSSVRMRRPGYKRWSVPPPPCR